MFFPFLPLSDLVDSVTCREKLGEGAKGNDLLDGRRKGETGDGERQERKKTHIFPKWKLPRGLSCGVNLVFRRSLGKGAPSKASWLRPAKYPGFLVASGALCWLAGTLQPEPLPRVLSSPRAHGPAMQCRALRVIFPLPCGKKEEGNLIPVYSQLFPAPPAVIWEV